MVESVPARKEILLITGSNGMVGHCIKELVTKFQPSDSSTANNLSQAEALFKERQDRESLMNYLGVIVPSVEFYFSTRAQDGDLSDANVVDALFTRL